MGGREKTYFEQQREALIGEIAMASHLPPLSNTVKQSANNQLRRASSMS
jgi:hypothetical protein